MGSNLDDSAMRQAITRTIATTPLVQDANIWEKKESAPNGDEASAPASVVSVEDLEMHEGMSQGEISVTQECCQIIEDLKKSGISQVERNNLNNQLIIKKRELFAEREKYNKAVSLFRNIKTPAYTSDVNKRGNPEADYMSYGVAGAEDPFYDEFMKLYPKRGFWGFVKDNPKLFENISNDDINNASRKYEKVDGIFSLIGESLRIPFIVGAALLFRKWTKEIPPLVYIASAVGLYKGIIDGFFCGSRGERANYDIEILEARWRIAKDLGIKKKDLEEDYSLKKTFKIDYPIDYPDESKGKQSKGKKRKKRKKSKSYGKLDRKKSRGIVKRRDKFFSS